MSELSEKLLSRTSKPAYVPALLAFEDGTVMRGNSCGAAGEVFGEMCFNTSVEGYLEVITDPSYAGQIVTMTYPQIGNYGVCRNDVQAQHPALRGLVVHDMCYTPSNFRSDQTLVQYLVEQGVVAIEGIDTRALVCKIREAGAMRAGISTTCLDADALVERVQSSEPLVGVNLVQTVSTPAKLQRAQSAGRFNVLAIDCGAKESIVSSLEAAGCNVELAPWDISANEVFSASPDGVFISNGPGDPDAVDATCNTVEQILGRVPVFGICMGHQLIARAAGARIEKLKFGHHGGNHPVKDLSTGRVEITVQNHGFGIVFESLGEPVADVSVPTVDNPKFGRIELSHVNLNDATPEGIRFLDIPAFSVQYHPEASPGPQDSWYLFGRFAQLMEAFHAQA